MFPQSVGGDRSVDLPLGNRLTVLVRNAEGRE
jgi:hypothetical protein